jgi:hypothetical protein
VTNKTKKIDHNLWAQRAAAEGALPYLKLALELGAKINGSKNQFGRIDKTPLAEAVMGDQTEAVKYLLAAGANPDLKMDDGLTPGAHARPEMAKVMYPKDDGKRRAAFALAFRTRAITWKNRDPLAEAQAWIDEGTNLLDTIFDGSSLASLLASIEIRGFASDLDRDKLIKTVLAAAESDADLAEAFAVSITARLFEIGPELAGRGALKNATPQALTDMLKACMSEYPMAQTGLALVNAGADPGEFVFPALNNGQLGQLAEVVKMHSSQCGQCADAKGHGLLHRVLERLIDAANDLERFDLLHGIALTLAKEPSARVLTGNGVGKYGPPTVSSAPFLSDAANFTNKKRAQKASALARLLIDKAMLEVAEFDATGNCPAAPLPDCMNILHLSIMSKQKEVESALLGIAAKLGAKKCAALAAEETYMADPWSQGAFKDLSPFDCMLFEARSQQDFGLGIKFARIAGPNSEIDGTNMFSALCMSYPLMPANADSFAEQIKALFDLGADPESKTADGQGLLAALLSRMKELVDKENKYWKKISLDDQQRAEATITEAFMSARLKAPRKSSAGKRTGVNAGL